MSGPSRAGTVDGQAPLDGFTTFEFTTSTRLVRSQKVTKVTLNAVL